MAGKLLLRGARQLLTLRGSSSPRRGEGLRELSIIEDGALLIANGAIQEVGPSRRIEKLAAARDVHEIDASGCVVLPGFVDCHTHLLDVSRRGARSWTTARIQAEALARLGSFVRHGTTTLGVKIDDAQEARILQALDGKPLDIVTAFVASGTEAVARVPKSARSVAVRGDHGGLDVFQAREVLAAARAAGYSVEVHGGGLAPLAVELGATSFSHLEGTTENDLELLAMSSTIVTLLPGASYQKRGRFGNGRKLVDSGAAVALASDFSPVTSLGASISTVLSLACNHSGLTVEEALSAVTINAAHAVGLPRLVGSLEAGKQADLAIFGVSDYRDIPAYFGTNLVKLTMKKGRVLFREQNIDWQDD